MWKKTVYEKTCSVTCSDTMKRMDATVLNFTPKHQLNVKSGAMTLSMRYNPRSDYYIAHSGGKEYRSGGPKPQ